MPSGGTGAFVLRVSSSAGLIVTKETQVLSLARKHGCGTAAADTFDIENVTSPHIWDTHVHYRLAIGTSYIHFSQISSYLFLLDR